MNNKSRILSGMNRTRTNNPMAGNPYAMSSNSKSGLLSSTSITPTIPKPKPSTTVSNESNNDSINNDSTTQEDNNDKESKQLLQGQGQSLQTPTTNPTQQQPQQSTPIKSPQPTIIPHISTPANNNYNTNQHQSDELISSHFTQGVLKPVQHDDNLIPLQPPSQPQPQSIQSTQVFPQPPVYQQPLVNPTLPTFTSSFTHHQTHLSQSPDNNPSTIFFQQLKNGVVPRGVNNQENNNVTSNTNSSSTSSTHLHSHSLHRTPSHSSFNNHAHNTAFHTDTDFTTQFLAPKQTQLDQHLLEENNPEDHISKILSQFNQFDFLGIDMTDSLPQSTQSHKEMTSTLPQKQSQQSQQSQMEHQSSIPIPPLDTIDTIDTSVANYLPPTTTATTATIANNSSSHLTQNNTPTFASRTAPTATPRFYPTSRPPNPTLQHHNLDSASPPGSGTLSSRSSQSIDYSIPSGHYSLEGNPMKKKPSDHMATHYHTNTTHSLLNNDTVNNNTNNGDGNSHRVAPNATTHLHSLNKKSYQLTPALFTPSFNDVQPLVLNNTMGSHTTRNYPKNTEKQQPMGHFDPTNQIPSLNLTNTPMQSSSRRVSTNHPDSYNRGGDGNYNFSYDDDGINGPQEGKGNNLTQTNTDFITKNFPSSTQFNNNTTSLNTHQNNIINNNVIDTISHVTNLTEYNHETLHVQILPMQIFCFNIPFNILINPVPSFLSDNTNQKQDLVVRKEQITIIIEVFSNLLNSLLKNGSTGWDQYSSDLHQSLSLSIDKIANMTTEGNSDIEANMVKCPHPDRFVHLLIRNDELSCLFDTNTMHRFMKLVEFDYKTLVKQIEMERILERFGKSNLPSKYHNTSQPPNPSNSLSSLSSSSLTRFDVITNLWNYLKSTYTEPLQQQPQQPQQPQQTVLWTPLRISQGAAMSNFEVESGLVSTISHCIANNHLPLFSLSTNDHEYCLIPADLVDLTLKALWHKFTNCSIIDLRYPELMVKQQAFNKYHAAAIKAAAINNNNNNNNNNKKKDDELNITTDLQPTMIINTTSKSSHNQSYLDDGIDDEDDGYDQPMPFQLNQATVNTEGIITPPSPQQQDQQQQPHQHSNVTPSSPVHSHRSNTSATVTISGANLDNLSTFGGTVDNSDFLVAQNLTKIDPIGLELRLLSHTIFLVPFTLTEIATQMSPRVLPAITSLISSSILNHFTRQNLQYQSSSDDIPLSTDYPHILNYPLQREMKSDVFFTYTEISEEVSILCDAQTLHQLCYDEYEETYLTSVTPLYNHLERFTVPILQEIDNYVKKSDSSNNASPQQQQQQQGYPSPLIHSLENNLNDYITQALPMKLQDINYPLWLLEGSNNADVNNGNNALYPTPPAFGIGFALERCRDIYLHHLFSQLPPNVLMGVLIELISFVHTIIQENGSSTSSFDMTIINPLLLNVIQTTIASIQDKDLVMEIMKDVTNGNDPNVTHENNPFDTTVKNIIATIITSSPRPSSFPHLVQQFSSLDCLRSSDQQQKLSPPSSPLSLLTLQSSLATFTQLLTPHLKMLLATLDDISIHHQLYQIVQEQQQLSSQDKNKSQSLVPPPAPSSWLGRSWRVFELQGVWDTTCVGIVATLSRSITEIGAEQQQQQKQKQQAEQSRVSKLCPLYLSSFRTDYIAVPLYGTSVAIQALQNEHKVASGFMSE